MAIFLIIAFCKPAYCDVFMYQDDAGKWHGVSSADQIPEQYRNQAETVDHPEAQAPDIDPVTGLNEQELARKLLGLDPAQPKKTEEQLKTELLKTIEENMAHLVGSQVATNWQMTDYKVVAVDISDTNSPWPNALITVKITASNSEEGDRNFIWKYTGSYSSFSGWSIFQLNDTSR